MTESQWLTTTDPVPMIWLIRKRGTDRQRRLAGCACYRAAWEAVGDSQFDGIIESGERLADGKSDYVEARATFENAMDRAMVFLPPQSLQDLEMNILMVRTAMCANPISNAPLAMLAPEEPALGGLLGRIRQAIGNRLPFGTRERPEAKPPIWCYLIRDIFGNPFHPVILNPAVLAWNDATVVRLARAAYDERHLLTGTLDEARLAILADALEEAGCTDPDIVGHLRGPGPHVRGCFAVDLCLGLT